MFDKTFLITLVKGLVGDASRKYLSREMQKDQEKIVAGMQAKGVTVSAQTMRFAVRDAMFRLWKGMVHSGDFADFLRDSMDDDVVPLVIADLDANADLDALVALTRDKMLVHLFGK